MQLTAFIFELVPFLNVTAHFRNIYLIVISIAAAFYPANGSIAATDLAPIAIDATPTFTEQKKGNSKTVRVGVSHNPPFALQGKGQKPTGFVIDIIRAVAKDNAWNLVYIERPWPVLLKLLDAGKIDVLGGIAYTSERAKKYQFTKQTTANNWAVVYKAENIKIDGIADMNGKRVSAIPGSVHEEAFKKLASSFEISYQLVAAKSYEETLELIDKGMADVGIVARSFHIFNGSNYQAVATNVRFNPIEIRIAAPKNSSPEILLAFDKFLSFQKNKPNSQYKQFLLKWFKGPAKSETSPWVIRIIVGIGIIIILTWVAIVWLHNKIEAKTADLQKSQARFRDFAETTSDWFWEMDADLCLSFMSQRPKILSGQDMNTYIGSKRTDNAAEDTNTEKWRNHFDDLKNHRPFRDFRYDINTASGAVMPIQISGIPVFDGDGIFTGYRGTGTDISERTLLEAKLQQSQRMEAVGQLTGGVAHDFNNLLGIMLGNAEILKNKSTKNNELYPRIEAILNAIDRAASLTSRLLAFSRKQTLSPETIDIGRLIDDTHTLLSRALGETIDHKIISDADLWPVTIDPHQFENALINLAINARDAMLGGGTLTISAKNVTIDGSDTERFQGITKDDYVLIAVSDTGTGMSNDVAEKAFEPFFTTKDVGKGSGLGLSMVYGFVIQSGGNIIINNQAATGTTIELYLPRSETEITTPKRINSTPEPLRGSERILVVEDDDLVREIPVNILRDQGYEIVEAKNGLEAINLLQSEKPFALLFTDVILPGNINGADIAATAKMKYPDIKIIFTTGYSQDVLMKDGTIEQSTTIVNKPYTRSELLDIIRTTLDQ